MVGDALPGRCLSPKPKSALTRLFGARPTSVLSDLGNRTDTAMRVMFDSAISGLLLIDLAGRIVRANPALRAMLEPEVDLTAGATAALIFAADERPAAWHKVRGLLSGRLVEARLNARLRRRVAETDRRTDIGCRVILEADGAIGGLLLRITDITAQIRREAQLAQSRETENVGRLVGGVAHDFNNLLTAILGAVELAQERDGDAALHSELETIRRGAERGAALVRNLLALGRRQHLQATPLDVNAALQEFAATIRPALGKDIALDVRLEQPGRRVRADPGQLDQVLRNLAMNARHAMPQGGRLTLRSGHATLYRSQVQGRETVPPGRYVTIAVQDTGTGIPPDLLDRIFEPFFTTRRAEGGSGFGLATAHGIVCQSGGFLTVDSEVGRGSTFRIYLPREDAKPRVATPAPKPDGRAAQAAHRRVLLLVEDEDTVRRITASALARQGWQVLQASSAEAALALLDGDPALTPSALVSDVVMPGQDGAALVEAVRARFPGLPAILVSGYAEGRLADRSAPDVAFLGKPYMPKALLARLEEIVPAAAETPASERR